LENPRGKVCLQTINLNIIIWINLMDYSKSKIYKLECEDGYYYYGTTIQSIDERLKSHKQSSKKQPYRVYKHINAIGWDKVKIILVENYPCESKKQLNRKESELIYQARKDEKCLNSILSYASEEQRKESREKYNETYVRPLTEKRIEHNHDYGIKYRQLKGHELKQKKSEYYYKNKEKRDEKNKENYYKNKEEILRKKREKYKLKNI
jgi:hypothetical protein